MDHIGPTLSCQGIYRPLIIYLIICRNYGLGVCLNPPTPTPFYKRTRSQGGSGREGVIGGMYCFLEMLYYFLGTLLRCCTTFLGLS